MEDCYTCQSISGERRISPGPTIYEGKHWLVEHAYPSKLKGWLVIVLKRHVEALHDLTRDEFAELSELQARTTLLLHKELDCEKEYAMCFAEAEHFKHIHVHLVPKPHGLPDELTGPRIFAMIKVDESGVVPPEDVRRLCEHLRARLALIP